MKTEFELEKKETPNMIYSVGPKKDTPRNQYRVGKNDISYMKQTITAFVGMYVVVAERDEFYGGEKSQAYQSEILINPTWGRLFACAKGVQRKTRDYHHQFFEGAYPKGKKIVDGTEVIVLNLSLGS